MLYTAPGLSQEKQTELRRALAEAGAEVVGQDLTLEMLDHPLTGETGMTMPLTSPDMADANLTIVLHKDSGCIQFVFPVQGAQPLPVQTPQAPQYQFAYMRARQFSLEQDLQGSLLWLGHAALKVADHMSDEAVHSIESHNKDEGFISMRHGYRQPATKEELAAAGNQRVLLFVHGIFSSIEGAFAKLSDAAVGGHDGQAMQQLLDRYNGHVFGYDHWTIAKTPQQNALDLLRQIPEGANWDVDIVCHSRGGLVVRSLLAAPAAGQTLHTPELHAIAQMRAGRIARLGKAIFVAAANQGSQLADPDQIRDFLNVAAILASVSGELALDVVIGLARMVVSLGFDLPTVQSLAMNSPLVQDLHAANTLLQTADTYYARADFDYNKSPLLDMGVLLDKLLMKVDNDLIVPYSGVLLPGAEPDQEHLHDFGAPGGKQHDVWHTTFFEQAAVQDLLLANLTGST